MSRPRVIALCAAVLAICGCTGDDGSGQDGPTQRWGGVAAVCAQWETVDAALAAESANSRAEIEALAELLPEEYKQDAALVYSPGAGDPGSDADGAKAEQAGERLDSFRLRECGPPA